jgi:hypothetical protein
MFPKGCSLARALHCSLISFAFDCIQGFIILFHHAIVISLWIFTTLKDWLSLNMKAFNLIHYSSHMLNNFRYLFFIIRLLQLCWKLDCKKLEIHEGVLYARKGSLQWLALSNAF